jgi:uncharacterized protein YajQ (UPF0234 family)
MAITSSRKLSTLLGLGQVVFLAMLLSGCGGGGGSSGGTSLPVTTPDTTAPTTNAGPSVSGTSGTATALSVTIDEDGTGYYLVLPAANSAPTIATVQAGTAFAMTANVAATPAINGLSVNTAYMIYFVAKDAANNVQASVQSVAVTTSALPDTTPPTTTFGPSVSGTTGTATTLSVTIDEDGTGYYLVLPAANSAPAVAAVQAGTAFAMTANVAVTPAISGLTATTAYKIYFVAKDTANNAQTTVQSVAVTTTSIPDLTAPTTTGGPSVSGTSTTGTTLSVTINENGIGYYLVLPTANPTPTITAVKAGIAFAMTANVAATRTISGLASNTAYKIHFVAKDTANNVQTTVQSVSVTTLIDSTPPATTMAPGIYVDTVWGDSFSVTINENGTGYYYLLPLTTPSPTVTPATVVANARGSFSMTANVAAYKAIWKLPATPAYILYFVAQDAAGNVQSASQVALRTSGYTIQGGLVWAPPYNFNANWLTMNSNCTTASINGQSGWRLPTVAELDSLSYASGPSSFLTWFTTALWASNVPSAGNHNVYDVLTHTIGFYPDASGVTSASCVR